MMLKTAINMLTLHKVCTTKAGTESNSFDQHSFVLISKLLNYLFLLLFSASFTEFIGSLARL